MQAWYEMDVAIMDESKQSPYRLVSQMGGSYP